MQLGDNVANSLWPTTSPRHSTSFASAHSVHNARIGLELVTLQCLQCTFVNQNWIGNCYFAMFANAPLLNWQGTREMKIVTLQCLQMHLCWTDKVLVRNEDCHFAMSAIAHCRTDKVLRCLDVWQERIGVMIHFNGAQVFLKFWVSSKLTYLHLKVFINQLYCKKRVFF
jgi:hypothetical protein